MKNDIQNTRRNVTETGANAERVVLIAGDLTGTARAAAFAFSGHGNHIVLASSDDAAGKALARALGSRNVDVAFIHADTNSAADVQHVIEETVQRYGHLDVEYLP